MKFLYTGALVALWIVVMQANLGWLGKETARRQVQDGLSAEEAWRRALRQTLLFAVAITAAAAWFGWRIWR